MRLPPVQELAVDIPDDTNRGWLGFGWLLAAMIPASIGGGVLQPSINSLITKRVEAHEIGGTLGISTAFFSGANAITPVVNGAIFDAFGSTAPFLIGGIILAILCGVGGLFGQAGEGSRYGGRLGSRRGGALGKDLMTIARSSILPAGVFDSTSGVWQHIDSYPQNIEQNRVKTRDLQHLVRRLFCSTALRCYCSPA